MSTTEKSSYVIFAVIALLILTAFFWLKMAEAPGANPISVAEDEVEIVVGSERLNIPEALTSQLKTIGVKGLVLVVNEEKVGLVRLDGTYVDLCNSSGATTYGTRSCSKEFTLAQLTFAAAQGDPNDCGHCDAGGKKNRKCSISIYKAGQDKPRNCSERKGWCDTPCK